ncbi:MAG: hypothetical protein M1816_005267 [Peltula sp. TS41687]|nr:MAG: hypothetical protein M1816_005267 [Peltula sp. TS41687]
MATNGFAKNAPTKYGHSNWTSRYALGGHPPARFPGARRIIPRKPREPPVQIQGSYIKKSNRFVLNQDNPGKEAWRHHQPPDGRYRLPSHMLHIFNSVDKKPQPPGRTSTKAATLKHILEQIALQTKANCVVGARFKRFHLNKDLRIWGRVDNVRSAKQLLEKWVNHYNKQVPRKDWPKVNTFSKKKKEQIDREMAEEALEQSWKRDPKEAERYTERAVYMWPEEGFPPMELLGRNLEAFDAIRTRHHCYIVLDPKTNWITVLSMRRKRVNAALRRIDATLHEMVARSKPSTKAYMINPPDPETVKREVEFVPYDHFINNWRDKWTTDGTPPVVVPAMAGQNTTDEEKRSWDVLQPKLKWVNDQTFKRNVRVILQRMHWYRAQIRMRVNFGIMAFRRYRMPTSPNHTIEDFLHMVENVQTEGDLVGEVDEDNSGANLLARCYQAVDVLDPRDAISRTLAEVPAEFSASFELAFVDTSGLIRLDVTFSKNLYGTFELSSSRWLRLEGREDASQQDMASEMRKDRTAMSLCTLDVERDMAWELEVTCRNIIPESRITESMRAFADGISLQVPNQRAPHLEKVPSPVLTMNVNELRVDGYTVNTHYRYMIRQSTYILEVTRAQKHTRGLPGQMQLSKTTWRPSLYHLDWDTYLDQQAALAVGEVGQWSTDWKSFFPAEDGHGVTTPKDNLAQFYDMVRAAAGVVGRMRG